MVLRSPVEVLGVSSAAVVLRSPAEALGVSSAVVVLRSPVMVVAAHKVAEVNYNTVFIKVTINRAWNRSAHFRLTQ